MSKQKHIQELASSLNEKTDQLWVDFINGDNICFEKIYNTYIKNLFQYGIQFTKDEEVVKDAIHDVFVRIYSNREHLKKHVSIKFYLFTALKNSLYNIFKRDLFFEKLNEEELLDILDHSAEYNILLPLEQEHEDRILRELMDRLTDRQREAIYYRFIEELSMEEISALMNMNTQSVQNLIQRSLRRMRKSNIPYLIIITCLFRDLQILSN